MDKNYYCNKVWFYSYDQARLYSETMLKLEGKYYVVFTKAEMDSQVKGMVNSIVNHAEHVLDCPAIDGFGCHCEDIIDHEEECGK